MGNNRMQAWFKLAGGKSDWFYFGFEEGIMKYEK